MALGVCNLGDLDVAEYDAFGRKIGEDQPVSVPVNPDAAPATPAPVTPATPKPQSPRSAPPSTSALPPGFRVSGVPGSGRSFAPLAMTILAVAMVGLIGGGIYLAVHKTTGVIDSVRKGLSDFNSPSPTTPGATSQPTPAPAPKPAAPPAGLSSSSLIRRGNLSAAVSRLRRGGLGRLVNLRVAADRVDAQLVTHDGRLRNVQITPDGTLSKLSLSGPGFGFVSTIPFAAVDTAAPQRLTSAAAHRRGVSPTRVDYLVVSRFGSQVVWGLFFKDGTHYQGDAAGRLR